MWRLNDIFGEVSQEKVIQFLIAFFMFAPRQGEGPDELMARFDLVKENAKEHCGMDMSYIGNAFMLPNAMKVPIRTWPTLLIPLDGELPSTKEAYEELKVLLRKNEHYRMGETRFRPESIGATDSAPVWGPGSGFNDLGALPSLAPSGP